MAGRPSNKSKLESVNKEAVKPVTEKVEAVVETAELTTSDLDMDAKITIKNIANWTVGFNKIESLGEVNINPNGSVRITRAEVISQFENGNKLIRGLDNGKHATIWIDDKATRQYLEIDWQYIDKKLVTSIFNISGLNDFANEIKSTFVTRAEKILLINIIRECKFNDFNKVRECEIHCGINV